jgi:hypothetical protein
VDSRPLHDPFGVASERREVFVRDSAFGCSGPGAEYFDSGERANFMLNREERLRRWQTRQGHFGWSHKK